MIVRMSNNIARWIKNADPYGPVSLEVMKYALCVLINLILVVGLSLMVGAVTGKLAGTWLAIIAFVSLRMFSGGFHFKSLDVCVIVSVILLAAIPHLAVYANQSTVVLMGIASLVLVSFKAPTSFDNTRLTNKHKPLFKVISMALVTSIFFITSPVIALSFLLQSILLIPKRR